MYNKWVLAYYGARRRPRPPPPDCPRAAALPCAPAGCAARRQPSHLRPRRLSVPRGADDVAHGLLCGAGLGHHSGGLGGASPHGRRQEAGSWGRMREVACAAAGCASARWRWHVPGATTSSCPSRLPPCLLLCRPLQTPTCARSCRSARSMPARCGWATPPISTCLFRSSKCSRCAPLPSGGLLRSPLVLCGRFPRHVRRGGRAVGHSAPARWRVPRRPPGRARPCAVRLMRRCRRVVAPSCPPGPPRPPCPWPSSPWAACLAPSTFPQVSWAARLRSESAARPRAFSCAGSGVFAGSSPSCMRPPRSRFGDCRPC